MAPSPYRPNAPSDPVRQQLVEVRRGLFRLHKTLIESERASFERVSGPLTNGQFLQALIHDPYFAWLRPFSTLIVEIDEALAPKEPIPVDVARGYLRQIRALIEPAEDEASEPRYDQVCRHDADVLLAHIELAQRMDAATDIHPPGR